MYHSALNQTDFVNQAFSSVICDLLNAALVDEQRVRTQDVARFVGALYQLYNVPPAYIKEPYFINGLVFHRESDHYRSNEEMVQAIQRICEQYLAQYRIHSAMETMDSFWRQHPQQGCIEAGCRALVKEETFNKPKKKSILFHAAKALWDNPQATDAKLLEEFMSYIFKIYNQLASHEQVNEALIYLSKALLSLLLDISLQNLENLPSKMDGFVYKIKMYFQTIGLWDVDGVAASFTSTAEHNSMAQLKQYLPKENGIIDDFIPKKDDIATVYQARDQLLQHNKANLVPYKLKLLQKLCNPQDVDLLFFWVQMDPDFFTEDVLLYRPNDNPFYSQSLISPMQYIATSRQGSFWILNWLEKNPHLLKDERFLRLLASHIKDERIESTASLLFMLSLSTMHKELANTVWEVLQKSDNDLLFVELMNDLTTVLPQKIWCAKNKVLLNPSLGGSMFMFAFEPMPLLLWIISKKNKLVSKNHVDVFRNFLSIANYFQMVSENGEQVKNGAIFLISQLLSCQKFDFQWVIDWIEDNKENLFKHDEFITLLCHENVFSVLIKLEKWGLIKV